MTKYVCIDTNVFIQCCLLDTEGGDTLRALNTLHKKLEEDKLVLLLPEVIELEFYNILEKKYEKIRDGVEKIKNNLENPNINKKLLKDISKKIDEFLNERERNKNLVRGKIKEIFSHKNTNKDLLIDADLITEGIKFNLSNKKPAKSNVATIQPDCLIIASLKKFLKDKDNYKFYFCSNNKSDFAENESDKISDPQIHPDIKSLFSHIVYYTNLFKLLNENFETKFSPEDIEELKEKDDSEIQQPESLNEQSFKDDKTGENKINNNQLA